MNFFHPFKQFFVYLLCTYYIIFKPNFYFKGKKYPYFCHNYLVTWRNERSVEVPIIWDILKKNKGKRILEIGNVLSHYFSVDHVIVDKYEKADRVINQDVLDIKPNNKYDLIVSISTLEHVGYDEIPKDPDKIARAIINLRDNCLKEGGELVMTIPLNYNPNFNDILKNDGIKFSEKNYLKRTSYFNTWKEVNWSSVNDVKYGKPYPNANAVFIGKIFK